MIKKILSELQEGINLPKCQKCGCMKETLEFITSFSTSKSLSGLKENTAKWQKQIENIKYSCLGCEHCYPAVAMNILNEVYPDSADQQSLSCSFDVKEESWPSVVGEYTSFCDGKDSSCPVAVSTLASVELADEISKNRPDELCIVGKTETENIGIDKIIKNIVTNRTIKYLILAGEEVKGHFTGNTLLSLWKSGVDENMRVIGANGKRPILRNVTTDEIEAFREQINVVDMIGCDDSGAIIEKIKEIASCSQPQLCGCPLSNKDRITPPRNKIRTQQPETVEMDRAGYFVIIPQRKKKIITVEYYSYDNKLQEAIEGRDARALYFIIIENKWVSLLSHAAYLGKELEKAELSMKYGFKYVQDGA